MRNWMICASVVLAIFQLWPMIFGHGANGTATTSMARPRLVAAVASSRLAPIKVAAMAPDGPPQSCYAHYRTLYTACPIGDRACHLRAADAWDLCEATGTWTK